MQEQKHPKRNATIAIALLFFSLAAISAYALINQAPEGTHYTYDFSTGFDVNPFIYRLFGQGFVDIGTSATAGAEPTEQGGSSDVINVNTFVVKNVDWILHKADGRDIVGDGHNLVMTNGLRWLANQTVCVSGTPDSEKAVYMALSTNVAALDVATITVPNEVTTNGGGKVTGTVVENSYGNHTVTGSWSFSGTISDIEQIYVCVTASASAAGDVFCGFDFDPSLNVGDGDSLEVNVDIVFSEVV